MTPGGNKYFVTFIDEVSRKLWIYLIKRKSDVIEVFKKFKVSVEKQCGKNLEILRTDGGVNMYLLSLLNFVRKKASHMK